MRPRRHGGTLWDGPRVPRILVPRPDHLGDLVLTLPAIAALRRRLPEAHITCIIPPPLMPIAERAVDVDEVLPMPFPMTGPAPAGDSPVLRSASAPLRGRFDLALLARPRDPWSGSLAVAAAVPIRVGHPQAATLPFLTHAFPERGSRHVAREAAILALQAAALLAAGRQGSSVRRRPGASPWRPLRLMPQDLAQAADVRRRLGLAAAPIVLHPGAGWPLKSWPAERWGRVASGLREGSSRPVLVVGAAGERALLEHIAGEAGRDVHAVHDLTLGTLAGLHASARLVVGMDSGALHLAAAVGAPVVGLFGPFGPRRVAPLTPAGRLAAISRSLPCSPCGTLEAPPCGALREPACLLAVPADEIIAAALRVERASG